jgi:hypothetical protein
MQQASLDKQKELLQCLHDIMECRLITTPNKDTKSAIKQKFTESYIDATLFSNGLIPVVRDTFWDSVITILQTNVKKQGWNLDRFRRYIVESTNSGSYTSMGLIRFIGRIIGDELQSRHFQHSEDSVHPRIDYNQFPACNPFSESRKYLLLQLLIVNTLVETDKSTNKAYFYILQCIISIPHLILLLFLFCFSNGRFAK